MPPDLLHHRFTSFDGVELAWHELGAGRPVMLIHGLFSSAETNWIKYGHAATIAERGFRIIMPDLRAHGDSAKPYDPGAYPVDVLERDGMALIAHLALSDYDLGGYSLGGRTVARMLASGCRPRRAIIAGMGYSGLTHTGPRVAHFQHILDNPGAFEKFSPEWHVEAFLRTTKGDIKALRLLLNAMPGLTASEVAAIPTPTLVLCGANDEDNGSAAALAEAMPDATLATVPGGHMSAVTKPELGEAMRDFLIAD
jgi:pimeloyl-ACP methyl ester carboxylesterase